MNTQKMKTMFDKRKTKQYKITIEEVADENTLVFDA